MAMQKRYTFQSLRSSLKADAAMGAWSMKQCNEYGHLINSTFIIGAIVPGGKMSATMTIFKI